MLAVGGLAHVIEGHPEMRSVWIALGLFVTLWWTWIGFAVLYNRRGADTRPDRLLFLAGSVPAGIAAIAIEPAAEGHSAAFATAMAVTRVVLAMANDADRQIVRAYGASALLFVISIWVPEPWRYLLWAMAIGFESGAVLRQDSVLSPREYVWLLMGWTVMCAALASTDAEDATEQLRSRGL